MAEKRPYKEILASVETHIIYVNNHLQNIDSHLERINNRLTDHDKAIANNTARISMIIKVGGGLIGLITILLGAGAIILKLFGVY